MSSRTLSYIFSLAISIPAHLSSAQDKPEQTLPVDSTSSKYIPTGVRIGYDLMTLGKSQFGNRMNGWEIAVDADFHRYFLVVEYGRWAVTDPLSNGTYSNDGGYYRIGIDVNFLKKDPVKNMFFLGGRFGHSSYQDQVIYKDTIPPFASFERFVQNPKVIATWVELTTGIKVKVWKYLWLGATARFKFGLDLDGNGPLQSYDVPGFGRNIARTTWGFNYYLMVRIPFRKEPAVTSRH
jgi:hypothetical protein